MQHSFKCIIFYPTLVVPTILEVRGRLISCEKNTTFPVVAKIINALCPLNLTRQTFKSSFYTGFYSFWQKTSVVVVIIDGPMHFYLG